MKLIATKSLTYATRRLTAGDEFEASERDARLLIGIKKARNPEQRVIGSVPPPPDDLLAKLRADADSLGLKPDKRWGAKRLQLEIEQAEADKPKDAAVDVNAVSI